MVQARGYSEIHSLTWVCSLKRKEKQGEMICMVADNWQLIYDTQIFHSIEYTLKGLIIEIWL